MANKKKPDEMAMVVDIEVDSSNNREVTLKSNEDTGWQGSRHPGASITCEPHAVKRHLSGLHLQSQDKISDDAKNTRRQDNGIR